MTCSTIEAVGTSAAFPLSELRLHVKLTPRNSPKSLFEDSFLVVLFESEKNCLQKQGNFNKTVDVASDHVRIIDMHMFVRLYACMFACMHVCMHACMYV